MRLANKIVVTLVVLLVPLGLMNFKNNSIENMKISDIVDEVKNVRFSQVIDNVTDNITNITHGIDIDATLNKIKASEGARIVTDCVDHIGNAVEDVMTYLRE